MHTLDIRIGTLVPGNAHAAHYIRQILPHGFESVGITFWKTLGDVDLDRLANEVEEVLGGTDVVFSHLGIFGNPLESGPEAADALRGWERLIDACEAFHCGIVAGFTGRLADQPIDASIPRFAAVHGELAKRAADRGVRLAYENCSMGGDWRRGDFNIAHNPDAWRLMFDALPVDNIGLQWEPAHQMDKLIEPLPQLKQWVKKVFHVHGKDATIHWDYLREHGIDAPIYFAEHRTPGFGDSNWTDFISELRRGGFTGSIDIEGWHDPVYQGDLEMTGQVHGLHYLQRCRGGAHVPNPA